MTALSLDERGTSINQMADQRDEWELYTDDPVVLRKMQKIGILPYKENSQGGKFYILESSNILIRKAPAKRVLTEAQRTVMAERLAENLGRL